MPSSFSNFVGIDFGTTNTVVSFIDSKGEPKSLRFRNSLGEGPILRSVITYLLEEIDSNHSRIISYCGQAAIDAFLTYGEDTRLIQSLKSFVASKSFEYSIIHKKKFTLEKILADFFTGMLASSASLLPFNIRDSKVLVGRPVKFAGASPDEYLAESRLRDAFFKVGVKNIEFALEPAAAAYFFVERLREPTIMLVADLGGGTSDFSIIEFDPKLHIVRPLSQSGVGIAGDTLDFRIIDHVIAPLFGKGSKYRPLNKWLEIPNYIYFEFEHWHTLSFLNRPKILADLTQIMKTCSEPAKIQSLITFIKHELGFHLYRAVNQCKMALSSSDHADLIFEHDSLNFHIQVSREDFEHWIERDVLAIDATCSEALSLANIAETDISTVFLTGGTSFVPLIRKRFSNRFPNARLSYGDEFVSIASGLALIAKNKT